MKRKLAKKLQLHRETLFHLDLVQGGVPPSELGSNCNACITRTIYPDTRGGDCVSAGCPSGYFTECATCAFC